MNTDWENKQYSILLVEDNKLNQTVVKFSLKRYGYDIDIANNGVEGLDKFEEGKYNFILMDIMMPEMDGFETTRQIRTKESKCRVPIIALTADAIVANESKCLELGMDAYIAKPFEVDNLFNILEKLKV